MGILGIGRVRSIKVLGGRAGSVRLYRESFRGCRFLLEGGCFFRVIFGAFLRVVRYSFFSISKFRVWRRFVW